MSDSIIRARIDPAVKNEATRLFREMGLTMSEALRLFLHRVIAEKGLPFPVGVPNAVTVAAVEAAERGEVEVTSIDQLAADWDDACEK